MDEHQLRVREVVATLQVVDGESLLSASMMERIVAAVLRAIESGRGDEASRKRDTRIGGESMQEEA